MFCNLIPFIHAPQQVTLLQSIIVSQELNSLTSYVSLLNDQLLPILVLLEACAIYNNSNYILGRIYFWWMCLVSLAWIYNALAIPLRASFNVSAGGWLYLWLILDYLLADPIYVADMVLIQTHLSFRSKGVLQVPTSVLKIYTS